MKDIMPGQGKYLNNVIEFFEMNGNSVKPEWATNGKTEADKVYTYDEALDLTGRGCYTYGLAVFLFLALQGITLDLFSTSVVITGACDLNLTHHQKTILLSMPLIGPIVMAWPWGYIADTKGRRKALIFSLWGSFIVSTISAFSPNWIILAILKFTSCSLSSGTQSLGYTLLGESCSQKFRGQFLTIVSTSFSSTFGVSILIGYIILNLDIRVDLEFITFSNWRLLILVFASPLGLSAVLLAFIYESPKFLLNAGYEKKAIDVLRNIMRVNGGDVTKYPVKRVVLKETTSVRLDKVPLWQSLVDQTLPLFKPPLLFKTIQLAYITASVYSVNNGFFTWLPFVMDSFYSGYQNETARSASICDMIVGSNKLATDMETCVGTVKELVVWISVIQAAVYTTLNFGISLLSRWKKSVIIGLILITFSSGIVIPSVTDKTASIILLNGFLINCLCISIIFSYYVDLIPTSYRAMAACLGVMVARSSSLVGSNLVGSYIDSHCTTSFYAWSAYAFSGAVACCFLPSDNRKTEN